MSPLGNEAASVALSREESARGQGTTDPAKVKDWRKDDESVTSKGKKLKPAVVREGSSAAKEDKGPSEAEKRRTALERKVDAAMAGAMAALKRCFEKGAEAGGKISIRFRLHRSGYVMSPAISGVGAGSATCAGRVLEKMKISGNNVGTIDIVRTLKFERRSVPR